MYKYAIDGVIYTIKDLSEKSGVAQENIRFRLKQGYSIEEAIKDRPVHESIKEFANSSFYRDWLGKTIDSVYEIYWKWSLLHDYEPITKVNFSRQIKIMFPIKTVCNRKGRIIRPL